VIPTESRTRTPTPVPFSTPSATPFAPVITPQLQGPRQNVELVGWIETVGPAADVFLSGDYLYIADYEVGLQVVDISALNSSGRVETVARLPVRSTAIKHGSVLARPHLGGRGETYLVAVHGEVAYLGSWRGLLAVDVSNPTAPQYIGSLIDNPPPDDLATTGNYLYALGSGRLFAFDVSDPAIPLTLATYEHTDTHRICGIASADHYVYAAVRGWGIVVLDVSDPRSPEHAGGHPGSPPEQPSLWQSLARDVEVSDERAYLIWDGRDVSFHTPQDCYAGLVVFDISLPSQPAQLGAYCAPGGLVLDAVTAGRYVYVAAGHSGLRVLDVSDPAAPLEVAYYDTAGVATGLAVGAGYVYVASELGVHILRFDAP